MKSWDTGLTFCWALQNIIQCSEKDQIKLEFLFPKMLLHKILPYGISAPLDPTALNVVHKATIHDATSRRSGPVPSLGTLSCAKRTRSYLGRLRMKRTSGKPWWYNWTFFLWDMINGFSMYANSLGVPHVHKWSNNLIDINMDRYLIPQAVTVTRGSHNPVSNS